MSDQEQNGSQEPEHSASEHSTEEIPDLGGLRFTDGQDPASSEQPLDTSESTQQISAADQADSHSEYPTTQQPAADDPFAMTPVAPLPPSGQDSLGYPTNPTDTAKTATNQTPQKKANKAVVAGAVAGLIAGLIGGVAGAGAIGMFNNSGGTVATGNQLNPANPEGLSPRADNSIAAIAEAVTPSVVSIKVVTGESGGTGTGFIISDDGYIMTNNHVISSAVGNRGSITVAFKNESTAEAKLVGRSPSYDIAVLKVDKSGLSPVTLGNSADVVVGDAAIAIGSPLGLEGTVTSGIISAVRRPVSAGGQGEASHISALQTDAAINPGNSGGPLVNAEGQVIGVNSSIATMGVSESGSASAGSIGLGFAIPINNAKRVADEIIASGESRVPIIGVQVDMQTPEQGGAVISGVTANEPGAKAGLQEGDRIVDIDGDRIADPAEALAVIRSHHPGDTIKVTVVTSSGETKTVDVTLTSMVG